MSYLIFLTRTRRAQVWQPLPSLTPVEFDAPEPINERFPTRVSLMQVASDGRTASAEAPGSVPTQNPALKP